MNPLYNYLLKLADDSFIMGQRLSEWCGEGPYLEEDIALTNIALDELGQANNFYVYASRVIDNGKSEDDIAFLRYEHEYVNAHWTELPNEDYAQTILKVYVFSVYQKLMYEALSNSANEELAAIAQKSLKEVRYHYTHAASWMKIFAQGTEESKSRLVKAVENIWEYTKGLFAKTEGEDDLVALNIAPNTDPCMKNSLRLQRKILQTSVWNTLKILSCSLNQELVTIQNISDISFVSFSTCREHILDVPGKSWNGTM